MYMRWSVDILEIINNAKLQFKKTIQKKIGHNIYKKCIQNILSPFNNKVLFSALARDIISMYKV